MSPTARFLGLVGGFLCLGGQLLAGVIPVELRNVSGHYFLLRGGEPFQVNGIGGTEHLELAARHGANSIRTWGGDPGDILDRAQELGMTVCVGLWIEHERHGFDYDDEQAVAIQVQRHKEIIDRYKDHPALLIWGIGNEIEIAYTNPRVWDAAETVAAYAREVDPHHPTMTVTAHLQPGVVREIRQRAPSIQILGINTYGGIGTIERLVNEHWHGPYLITEWGPNGQWEVDFTSWGAEIESTSTEKAAQRALRHSRILADRRGCLGGFAFLWGSKQEVTPTWYGIFTADGAATESLEVLAFAWSGAYPADRAPRIGQLRLNGQRAIDSVSLARGQAAVATFPLLDGGGKIHELRWTLREESRDRRAGGDREEPAADVPLRHPHASSQNLTFSAPLKPGAYRLFLYAYGEGRRTVATANFPFLVD